MEKENLKSKVAVQSRGSIHRVSGSGLSSYSISDWIVRMNRDVTNHEPELICMWSSYISSHQRPRGKYEIVNLGLKITNQSHQPQPTRWDSYWKLSDADDLSIRDLPSK